MSRRLQTWLQQEHILLFLKALATVLLLLIPNIATAKVTTRGVTFERHRVAAVAFEGFVDAVSAVVPREGEVDILLSGRWVRLELDPDQDPGDRSSQLVFFERATELVLLRSSAPLTLTLLTYDVPHAPLSFTVASTQLPRISVIPREVWGADETLRITQHGSASEESTTEEGVRTTEEKPAERIWQCLLRQQHYPEEFRAKGKVTEDDQGRALTWPLEYSEKVDLIVVHHTAESLANATSRTGEERVRALYEYHTVGRGWGDIGYHFLIDESGKVYEGRAGGPAVVGAHTYCNNIGTVSVAMLGDFSKQRPTPAQVRALRLLAATLLDLYEIDPKSEVLVHGLPLPRIVGHRALSSTACPGPYLDEILPQVRLFTVSRDLSLPVYSSVLPETTQRLAVLAPLSPLTLNAGERRRVRVRVRNVSETSWSAQTWLLGKSEGRVTFPYLHDRGFVAGTLAVRKPIPPQGEALFSVDLAAGFDPGIAHVSLIPVVNGKQRLMRDPLTLSVTILAEDTSYALQSISFPLEIEEGKDLRGSVVLRNSGTVPWMDLALATDGPVLAHIVEGPDEVLPGNSGTFTVALQHLPPGDTSVPLMVRFADGTSLHGTPIVARTTVHASHIPYQQEAEEQVASAPLGPVTPKRSQGERAPPPPYKDQYLITGDQADLQLFERPEYDLFPREQLRIEAHLRSKGQGIARDEAIFPVERSDSALLLFDEHQRRIGSLLFAPVALLPFSGIRTEFKLIAPRRPGSYTLTIGDRVMRIKVREDLRRPSRRRVSQRTPERPAHATASASTPGRIRIRLSFTEPTVILQVSQRARIEGEGPTIPVEGPARLSRKENRCAATSGDHSTSAAVVRLLPSEGGVTTILNWDGDHRFRGVLECRIIDDALTLVNDLPLEEYLAGLSEEPDTEPYEKQRAFAIAARSYALYYTTSNERKFLGKPYDGSDDPATFQAYRGLSFEQGNPEWVRAAKDTQGRVLTYGGQVVKPPYYSSDDGRTRSPREAGWGDWPHAPYLQSKPSFCEGEPLRGHGVGMSGCGAEVLANRGKSAEEILAYYYPGTTIEMKR